MLLIESPSVALNDVRGSTQYQLDVNKLVSPNETIRQLVDWVLPIAHKNLRNKYHGIANLVLAGHGGPGVFQLGTGLDTSSMGPFGDLCGKVRKIWFKGCLVGRIMADVTPEHGDAEILEKYGFTSGDGHAFLTDFARLTMAYVIAPTEIQTSPGGMCPRGQLYPYQGLLLCYDPDGNVSWQHRSPSVYDHNVAQRTARNPNRY